MNKNVRFGKISEDKLGLIQEKTKRGARVAPWGRYRDDLFCLGK